MTTMTRPRVNYEWDAEEVDEHGDILNHNHAATLAEVRQIVRRGPMCEGCRFEVVLVRDEWNDGDLEDRLWAYLNADGTLPATFSTAGPEGLAATSVNVPKRFHAEARAR